MPKNATTTRVTPCSWEVYTAPIGTPLPVASAAIAAPFVSLGIIKDDPTLGVEIEDFDIDASNSCTAVRKVLKSRTFTWEFDQAQWTKATIENYFGVGVWAASGTGERWTPGALAVVEKALLFQLIDGGQELRILHPRVAFTPSGDIEFLTDDLVTLPVTATVLAPASGAEIFIDAFPALLAV